jgi:hypothetical protein
MLVPVLRKQPVAEKRALQRAIPAGVTVWQFAKAVQFRAGFDNQMLDELVPA